MALNVIFYLLNVLLFGAVLCATGNWFGGVLLTIGNLLCVFGLCLRAHSAGVKETKDSWADTIAKTEYSSFDDGYTAGQRAANDHIRKMMEDALR